ncbi:MAG: DUF2760 domain-containing protein, partial [Alphaproteobacteria bacterium]|nr:DUF2760 domain-containing protein [Alphaproteobacteria bacterium]
MRIFMVTIAFVLLLLTDLALVPDAALAPYGVTAYLAFLPKATALVAGLLFVAVIMNRPKAPAAETQAPAPPANQADAEVVHFLALLQDKGRLVDFLMGDVSAYSD